MTNPKTLLTSTENSEYAKSPKEDTNRSNPVAFITNAKNLYISIAS